MSRRKILGLAAFTLLIFPLVGIIILYFFKEGQYDLMLRSKESLWVQIILGLAIGIAFGFCAWYISESKWVSPKSSKYLSIIGRLNLKHIDIIFISLCAGIGEELLFRGAIQPLLGVWITALIFVLIHGYIDPRDWRISIYGLSMTIIIAVLGYLCESVGIWTAAIAHAMIDYVLLRLMIRKWNDEKKQMLNQHSLEFIGESFDEV